MTFVVDASVAVAWVFEDERTPETDRWLDLLTATRAVVPAHWSLEVANVIIRGARAKRIAARSVRETLALLGALPLQVDDATADAALARTAEVAMRYGLTTYDAAYLELAERLALPLATRDRALGRAARSAGVALLE